MSSTTKMRWSDLDENDDGGVGVGDLSFLLPPRVVVGPDENGIKKTVEYRFNEEGRTVRVTTTTRVREVARTRVTKRAAERRGWAKFGDAAHEDDAAARLTVVSPEEIVLERPRAPGTKAEDPLIPALDKGAALMICRTCGAKGSHWTSKCPNKDLAPQLDSLLDNNRPPTPDNNTNNGGGSRPGKYVPPRPKESEMRRRNDENSVRVSNLSEDTREDDIRELFGSFGPLTRAYVALDHRTGESKGFGFVSFVYKEHAENAISKLNGYGYDSLILHVEWAAPRPN